MNFLECLKGLSYSYITAYSKKTGYKSSYIYAHVHPKLNKYMLISTRQVHVNVNL